MTIKARFAHTNLIAKDWRCLAAFYESVFGCVPVPPIRDFSEEWLARGSGIEGAALSGVHLRLPGCGDAGPTLEIFQYNRVESISQPVANRVGFGHIAFAVEDVAAAREAVLNAGGAPLGEIVCFHLPGTRATITWVYVRDPEGNIIELQKRDENATSRTST